VWNAWAGFDPLSYEYGREKHQHDFEMDMAYECRAEIALKSLQREFGNKAEFTSDEIEGRAQELDEAREYLESQFSFCDDPVSFTDEEIEARARAARCYPED
jgi:hypothetical protein